MIPGNKSSGDPYEALKNASRILMEVELRPVQGNRFQPTGFPDIGAAVYERPDGKRMILVESAQSMANRLEDVCFSANKIDIAEELNGLPYIKVKLKDETGETRETSSLIEAHRLNSPYIMSDKGFIENLKNMADYRKGKAIDWRKVGKALIFYDPNSLIHGTFLANLEDGRFKVPRILTAFIEAEGIREAESGGVKINQIDPSGTLRTENVGSNVYGNVPYHRMEYTAEKITAYFNIDLSLINGYSLEEPSRRLLISLSLYKIVKFLNGSLRLRTSCDLKKEGEIKVKEPNEFRVPDIEWLKKDISSLLKECTDMGLFSQPSVTELNVAVKKVKEKDSKNKSSENNEEEESEEE